MKKTMVTIATLLLSGMLIAQDYTPPKAASDALKAKHPTAEVDEWVDFETELICYFEENGNFGTAYFSMRGGWLRTEFNLSAGELPQIVAREIATKYKGYEILDVSNLIDNKSSVYQLFLYDEEAEKDYKVIADKGGKIISEELLTTEDDTFE